MEYFRRHGIIIRLKYKNVEITLYILSRNFCKMIATYCIILIAFIKFSMKRNIFLKYDSNYVEIMFISYGFLKTVEKNDPQMTLLIIRM